jgi:hypothetical protein
LGFECVLVVASDLARSATQNAMAGSAGHSITSARRASDIFSTLIRLVLPGIL